MTKTRCFNITSCKFQIISFNKSKHKLEKMASHSLPLLLLLLLAISFFKPSQSAGIATYWGQHTDEGTLAAACATGNYQFVIIAFLTTFGDGQTPVLNLAGHCDPSSTCSALSYDIKSCQDQGVKVFLSLGGAVGSYSISSPENAGEVSGYLWNNFLGGQSNSRPFGDAVLDGIDFDIASGSGQFWDSLAQALATDDSEKRVYLSAAPQCPIPDDRLDGAIKTGLFDYVWVQFYNNPQCEYGENADALLARWNEWTQVNSQQIFLGLPAATGAAGSGYILPDVLTSQVLPMIKGSPKYGGVMVWNRFFDQQNGFSDAIKENIGCHGQNCTGTYGGTGISPTNAVSYNGAGQKVNMKRKPVIGFSCGIAGILFLCFVIHCWRKRLRGKPLNQQIEMFIRDYGTLAPKRYTYSEIKKMTNSFKEELGRGGYGSVYKGLSPDGQLIAVKIFFGALGDGEDFINEVASISRTCHVNIVTLYGFCIEGKKRALIYEFMPNGSLDKFLHGDESRLDWNTLFQIAKGIARGLEYLHRGCSTRMVHFDIKPHNILLDEEFVPKISDFGLAKLCKKKESIVSVMGARGTAGYMAPEVFLKSLGGASHKSDVYSYGMMILEMTGARENNNACPTSKSEAYFPEWIYKKVEAGDNLGVYGVSNEDEDELARKMVTVSLWCIQSSPSDRPSISKVVEMLEGSLESLQVPPSRFWASPTRPAQNSSSIGSTGKRSSIVQSAGEEFSS